MAGNCELSWIIWCLLSCASVAARDWSSSWHRHCHCVSVENACSQSRRPGYLLLPLIGFVWSAKWTLRHDVHCMTCSASWQPLIDAGTAGDELLPGWTWRPQLLALSEWGMRPCTWDICFCLVAFKFCYLLMLHSGWSCSRFSKHLVGLFHDLNLSTPIGSSEVVPSADAYACDCSAQVTIANWHCLDDTYAMATGERVRRLWFQEGRTCCHGSWLCMVQTSWCCMLYYVFCIVYIC